MALAQEYAREKQKTQDMYRYLALLEKPVEEKLEKILNYRKVLNLLNQEHELLKDQMRQIQVEAGQLPNYHPQGASERANHVSSV